MGKRVASVTETLSGTKAEFHHNFIIIFTSQLSGDFQNAIKRQDIQT